MTRPWQGANVSRAGVVCNYRTCFPGLCKAGFGPHGDGEDLSRGRLVAYSEETAFFRLVSKANPYEAF